MLNDKELEMCQCGTDAQTRGYCMREKVFVQDGMYVHNGMCGQGCGLYMPPPL